MKMKHFVVLYVIIFKYFTLPDDGFLNVIYSQLMQNVVVIDCFYFSVV
jgi:hypothetical protein